MSKKVYVHFEPARATETIQVLMDSTAESLVAAFTQICTGRGLSIPQFDCLNLLDDSGTVLARNSPIYDAIENKADLFIVSRENAKGNSRVITGKLAIFPFECCETSLQAPTQTIH
jgi:hypothetical protein